MVGTGAASSEYRDCSIYIIVESCSPTLFTHPNYNLTILREVGCNPSIILAFGWKTNFPMLFFDLDAYRGRRARFFRR